jgi:hypothetical protein
LPQTDLFEMRRLEMLSNTIFGVAMTLLAYDLPKASSFKQAPTGSTGSRLCATGHRAGDQLRRRRPVLVQPSPAACGGAGSRARRGVPQSVFLLAIIILPVTNGLYGSYPARWRGRGDLRLPSDVIAT